MEYTVYYECDENGDPFEFPTKNERWKTAEQEYFSKIPSAPVAYWVSEAMLSAFDSPKIGDLAFPKTGFTTGENEAFLRLWFEVSSAEMQKSVFLE